jgi:hypothetical protein
MESPGRRLWNSPVSSRDLRCEPETAYCRRLTKEHTVSGMSGRFSCDTRASQTHTGTQPEGGAAPVYCGATPLLRPGAFATLPMRWVGGWSAEGALICMSAHGQRHEGSLPLERQVTGGRASPAPLNGEDRPSNSDVSQT